jgi:hypothetical protein
MAAASNVFNDPKIVAAELLAADSRIPQLLCMGVHAAAVHVTGGVNKPFIGKGICVRPISSPVADRIRACETVYERGTINYYPDDLMVIGGMAITLYDYVIRDIKESRMLPLLKNSLTKHTSDIDMVWWPRSSFTNKVITINSKGIMDLRDKLIEKITDEMESTFRMPAVMDMVLHNVNNAKSFIIKVSSKYSPPIYGAIHICIYFIITYEDGKTIELEMCDIAIHDSGSSQQHKSNTLELMKKDPVYCNPSTEINRLAVNPPFYINVPIIKKLVDQQLLAFHNLLKKNDNKCIINYNRLRYIQSVIIPHNAHRLNLLTEFHMSDQDVHQTIARIDTYLHDIILKQCTGKDGDLCMKLMGRYRKDLKEMEQTLVKQHEEQRRALELQHEHAQKQLMLNQGLRAYNQFRMSQRSKLHIPAPVVQSHGKPPKHPGSHSKRLSKGGRHKKYRTQRKRR